MKHNDGLETKDSNMAALNSLLFVPGSRPDRFEKAFGTDADAVCIDLEDAVAADAKVGARTAVLSALPQLPAGRTAVRINGLRTAAGLADLLALAERSAHVDYIFLPMVESSEQMHIAAAILGAEARLVPLIETVSGLEAATEIARAPCVAAIMLGGGDLSAELGVDLAFEPLLTARQLFVMAAAAARVAAIDVPYIHLDNAEGLAEETRRVRALGFTAKAAIHPRQLGTINDIMRPSENELAEARAALEAYEAGGRQVIQHNGRMLEAPIVARFERLLGIERETANA